MIFKLSLKLDVSLGNILLGVAGCSVAVCAYKFYSTEKDEQITSLKSEVINTSDQNQSINAKSDEKGHGPSTVSSKEKVLSINEQCLDENKQKFQPSEADNVNNVEENDATHRVSKTPEFPGTNSDGSDESEVINISDSKQNISAKSDEKGHDPSIVSSERKVISSSEPSLDEKKKKFKSLEAHNAYNFEENDFTDLTLSEVPDTIILDSSLWMNTVDDKGQGTNLSTQERKKYFQQTGTREVNAKPNVSFQSNVKDLAKRHLNVKDNAPRSVKSSSEESATKSKKSSSSKIKDSTPSSKKGSVSVKSTIKVHVEPSLTSNNQVPSGVKLAAVKHKVKSEANKFHNAIKESPEISLGKTNTSNVLDKKLTDVHNKTQILVPDGNLRSTSKSTSDKKEACSINMADDDNEIETKEANLNGDQNNEANVTKSGITEKNGPVENLLYGTIDFEKLLHLVEKQQEKLGEVINEFKDIKPECYISLINKRLQQLEEASKETAIKELSESIKEVCESEKTELSWLRSIKPEYRSYMSTDTLENIKSFYGLFVDTLKRLVTIKSQLESNIREETQVKCLCVSFRASVKQANKILDTPRSVLQKTLDYINKLLGYMQLEKIIDCHF